MFAKKITAFTMFSFLSSVVACSSAPEERTDAIEQHVEPAKSDNKEMVCLRQDDKNPGHPNADDYNANKNDPAWLKQWTSTLGEIMSANASDCSEEVKTVIWCIDPKAGAQEVTVTRARTFSLKTDQEKSRVEETLKAQASCQQNYCDDSTGGGFGGGFCKDPHFESPTRNKTSKVELTTAPKEDIVVQIAALGPGGVTVKAGTKVAESAPIAYGCAGELERPVAACSALGLKAEMSCDLLSKRTPLWMSCRTVAVGPNGELRSSEAGSQEIGSVAGWGISKGEPKITTTCSGCRPPGGGPNDPAGVPYCGDLGKVCQNPGVKPVSGK